jgi:hypothetical protein
MKKIWLLCLLCAWMGKSFAQKQTFDLATFTPPKSWKKKLSENAIQLSKEDTAKRIYSLIILYKAMPGTAASPENFDLAWTALVKEMVTVSTEPEMQAPQTKDGWETQSGHAPFESESGKGVVILATATGSDKMVNMLILTNTNVHEKEISAFVASLSLKKITAVAKKTAPQPANTAGSQIINTWASVSSDQSASMVNNGVAGHIRRQYIFNSNGTYKHFVKTFSFFSDLLLTEESGTYTINGNTITVTPQQATIESWSKKDNRDEWGKRLSSQKAITEKVTYQFTIEYNAVISETQLILQADKATKRDGHFHQDNKWYYKLPTHDYDLIKLPR